MTFDVSRGRSFRRAPRATILAGHDEAAPEGGRHRFEEEPPTRVEETRAMLGDVSNVSDRQAADCNQR